MTASRTCVLLALVACVCVAGCMEKTEKVPRANYGQSAKPREETVLQGPPAPTVEMAFQNMDRDEGGTLSVEEFVGSRRGERAVSQARDIFRLCDRDQDGKLTFEEFRVKPPEAGFRARDRNGDGALDLEEFYGAEMPNASPVQAERMFHALDKDGDKKLSSDELWQRAPESLFVRCDANLDESVSRSEFEAVYLGLVKSGRSQRVFAAWDLDGDGRLSRDEMRERPQEPDFLMKDSDSDGRLTLEEFAVGVPARKMAGIRETFRSKDQNGDGVLTFRELSFRPADAGFWELDRDGDARLGAEEFAAGADRRKVEEAKEAFVASDLNRDGQLCLEEYRQLRTRDPAKVKPELALCLDFAAVEDNWTADASGYRHHARFNGGRILGDEKQRVLELDGSSSLPIPAMPSSLCPDWRPLVLSAWCWPARGEGVVASMGGRGEGFSLYLKEGRPRVAVRWRTSLMLAASADPVPLEQWVHLAGGIDAKGRLRLYVNGQLAAEAPGRLLTKRPNETLLVGADQGSLVGEYETPQRWLGRLADVRLSWGSVDGEKLPAEMLGAAPSVGPSAVPVGPQPWLRTAVFADLDSDHDGRLMPADFAAAYPAKDFPKMAEDLFALLDANQDGALVAAEFTAWSPAVGFRRRDRDGDGKLTAAEFLAEELHFASAEHKARLWKAMDQDGDGAVSAEEFQKQSPEALVLRMDLDQDGLLSLDEYEAANGTLVAGGRSRRIFAAWDGDGDGRLSLEEFAAKPPQVEFHQKDADADGRLTYEEYAPGVPPDKVAAVRERFGTMDRDGDGMLSLEEYRRRPTRDPAKVKRELVLHLDFAVIEDNWAADASGHGHHGRFQGGKIVGDEGERALELDGSSFVAIPSTPSTLSPDYRPLVVSAWCYPAGSEGAVASMGGVGEGFSLYSKDGRPQFAVRSAAALFSVGASEPVEVERWVHVAGAVDAKGRLRLFVDGLSVGEAEGRLLTKRPGEVLFVGTDEGSLVGEYQAPPRWQGQLADVRIWWGSVDGENLDAEMLGEAPKLERSAAVVGPQPPVPPKFGDLDADRDGRLTPQEFAAAYPDGDLPNMAKDLFAMLDANKDGGLAAEEFGAGSAAIGFRKRDRDGDGKLTAAELLPEELHFASAEQKARLMKAVDQDGDGAVSLGEFEVADGCWSGPALRETVRRRGGAPPGVGLRAWPCRCRRITLRGSARCSMCAT